MAGLGRARQGKARQGEKGRIFEVRPFPILASTRHDLIYLLLTSGNVVPTGSEKYEASPVAQNNLTRFAVRKHATVAAGSIAYSFVHIGVVIDADPTILWLHPDCKVAQAHPR
jgi:hypothetical protein